LWLAIHVIRRQRTWLFLEVIFVLVQKSVKKGNREFIGGTPCPAGQPWHVRKEWDPN
jgi:hypothetical protein